MRRLFLALMFLCLLCVSCDLTRALHTATPDPGEPREQAVQTSTATQPAVPTFTPVPTHTIPSPTSTSTPTPTASPTLPAPEAPGETYVIEEERWVGDYVIRLWRNTSGDGFGFDNVATLSGAGQPEVRIELVAELGRETGTDLTGEGHPDAVIRVFTGGAHCCFSTIVYDLGPTPTKVLETPLSNCGGSFQDLDGDGAAEYVTCDDLFAYAYCPYAGSPMAKVVLQYQPGQGYLPASPRFARAYDEAIAVHTKGAEAVQPGEMGEWDETTKCSVLPLILDYVYSGQDGKARSEFNRLYDHPDASLFWAEVMQAVVSSPLYTPGSVAPLAPSPSYYMLQLLSGCDVDLQHIVGVLGEGQASCATGVPRRDIYWLQMQLTRAGLLAEDEMLVLAPEDCADECRLDVVRVSDSALVGGIRLDTEVGFPGQVYRVNGEESDRWRLRGDLTWERVPK